MKRKLKETDMLKATYAGHADCAHANGHGKISTGTAFTVWKIAELERGLRIIISR